jgi:hypothetical protein
MIEGFGSVPLTNGSRSPKSIGTDPQNYFKGRKFVRSHNTVVFLYFFLTDRTWIRTKTLMVDPNTEAQIIT